jgi:flavodoxin
MKALIVYHSKTGHTRQAAEDIARGLEATGVECVIRDAAQGTAGPVEEFDIVLVGSPTYGNRGYHKPARPVERFLDAMSPSGLEGKVCAAFTVHAAMGGGSVLSGMEEMLAERGGRVVSGGPVVKAGAPLSLWKGPDASQADVQTCEEFGKRVAQQIA